MNLATASGYQPNSVCVNFARTHKMKYGKLYIDTFLSEDEVPLSMLVIGSRPFLNQQTMHVLSKILKRCADQSHFMEFMTDNMKKHLNFGASLFYRIVLHTISSSANGEMETANGKSMAALFTAFDRQKYQKLIPQHIADLLMIPSQIIWGVHSKPQRSPRSQYWCQ